jgi:hypothetical protein
MGNPNPFYRFEPGWNAGFYPYNQIISDLLNEVEADIIAALPTIAVIGTTTTSQLFASFKAIVDPYNAHPYYGNFKVEISVTPLGLNYAFVITVRNEALFATDSTQQVEYSGLATNPGKTLINIIATGFTPGAYGGTFVAPLIETELKVKEALNVVDMNGSAFFPITYKFDPSTEIATSGLARGKNWKLDNGSINRFPAPTAPYMAQRIFELPQLSGDDQYIISIMERIIEASLANNDYTTSVLATFNSFSLPDSWTSSINYPSFTSYERVQFNFIDSTRRKFILVGRKDNNWLWQRFVSDHFATSPYDFLANYVETTALPYEPNQAGRFIYQNETYDFEFVEFTSGCYVSPEFYPMPAKPGDQWQFNVVDGNLEGIDQVDVGLFTESGEFIQKIGEAKLLYLECDCIETECNNLVVSYTISVEDWPAYLVALNQFRVQNKATSIQFRLFEVGNPTPLDTIGTSFAPSIILTETQISEMCDGTDFIFTTNGEYKWTYTITDAECGKQYYIENRILAGFNPVEIEILWTSENFICPAPVLELTQHQASVTIPSKQGCYRMGLYRLPEQTPEPTNNCEITFPKSYNTVQTDEFIFAINELYGTENPYVAFTLNGQTYIYTVPLVEDYLEIAPLLVAWANSTIPGMVALFDMDFFVISFEWTVEIECGSETVFSVCASNSTGECLNTEFPWFVTETACCPCEPNCQATFQNDLPISGCPWVADVEAYPDDYFGFFLTDSESFPYENKICLHKIRISNLLMGEGDDFCNFWTNLTNWLAGIPEMSYTLTWPDDDECISAEKCDYQFNFLFTPYIPCNTSYKFTWGVLDVSDNLLEIEYNYAPVLCECPVIPPEDNNYGLYSLSNIINIDRADCFSTILEFWADSNSIAQGMEYYNNWKQRVRIGLNGGGEKPIIEESLYRQSNGVHRRPQNKQDLSLDLHTDFFDLDTQLAMTDATRHPYLIWEGKSIFVKGDVEVATTQDFTTQSSFETLSQMKFQALIQGFQPRNSSCLTC